MEQVRGGGGDGRGEEGEARGGGGGWSRHSQRQGRQVGEKTGQSVGLVSFGFDYLQNEERQNKSPVAEASR